MVFISDFPRSSVFDLTSSSACRLRSVTRAHRGYRDMRGCENSARGPRTRFSPPLSDPTSFKLCFSILPRLLRFT